MNRQLTSGSLGWARIAIVVGIAFGVSGGAVAIGSTQGPPPVSSAGHLPSAERRAIGAADRRTIPGTLKREFRVFRVASARAANASIPTWEQAFLARDAHGLNMSDAVWVAPRGGPGTWVVPGTNGVCLLDTQFNQVCQGLRGRGSPASGGFVGIDGPPVAPHQVTTKTGPNSYSVKLVGSSTAPPAGTYTVTGLVPDGNTSVVLTLHNGTTASAQVTDNVYSVQVGAPPTSVTTKDSSGHSVTWALLK